MILLDNYACDECKKLLPEQIGMWAVGYWDPGLRLAERPEDNPSWEFCSLGCMLEFVESKLISTGSLPPSDREVGYD